MRYFCEGAGPAPGLPGQDKGRNKHQPTSLRLGDHLAGPGGGGRGDSRNEEADIEKWFVWVTWLAGCRDGDRRRKLSAQNFRQKLIVFFVCCCKMSIL